MEGHCVSSPQKKSPVVTQSSLSNINTIERCDEQNVVLEEIYRDLGPNSDVRKFRLITLHPELDHTYLRKPVHIPIVGISALDILKV